MNSLKHRLAVVWLQHKGFHVVQGNMYQSHHFKAGSDCVKNPSNTCELTGLLLGQRVRGETEAKTMQLSLNAGSIKKAASKAGVKTKELSFGPELKS